MFFSFKEIPKNEKNFSQNQTKEEISQNPTKGDNVDALTKLSVIKEKKENNLEPFNEDGLIKKIISVETPTECLLEPAKDEPVEIFNMKQEEKNIIEINEEENGNDSNTNNDPMKELDFQREDNLKIENQEKKEIESLPEIIEENVELNVEEAIIKNDEKNLINDLEFGNNANNDLETFEKNISIENNKIDSNVESDENFLNDLDLEAKKEIENLESEVDENLNLGENNKLKLEIEIESTKEIEKDDHGIVDERNETEHISAGEVQLIVENLLERVPEIEIVFKKELEDEKEKNNDKIDEEFKNEFELEKEELFVEDVKLKSEELKEKNENFNNQKTQENMEILVNENEENVEDPLEVPNQRSKPNDFQEVMEIEKTNEILDTNLTKKDEKINQNDDLFEDKNIYDKSLLGTEKATKLIDKTESNIIISSHNQNNLPKISVQGLSDHYAVEPPKAYTKNQKIVGKKAGFFFCC